MISKVIGFEDNHCDHMLGNNTLSISLALIGQE